MDLLLPPCPWWTLHRGRCLCLVEAGGGRVALYQCWVYQEEATERGIHPYLPALFLTKAFRVLKGKVYKIC